MKVLLLIVFLAVTAAAQLPDLNDFKAVREENGLISLINTKTITGEFKAVEFDALLTQYRFEGTEQYLNSGFFLHLRIRASCSDHSYAFIRVERMNGDKHTAEVPEKPKLEKGIKGSDIYRAIDMACEKKFGLLALTNKHIS